MLAPRTGMGRYVERVVSALLHAEERLEVLLYAFFFRGYARRRAALFHPVSPRIEVWSRRIPQSLLDRLWSLPWSGFLSIERLLPHCDLIHFGHLASAPTKRPCVYTLHDANAWRHPELHTVPSLRIRTEAKFLRTGEGPIVCLSHATARDALAFFEVEPSRLHVVYPGVDERFRPPTPEEAEAFRRRRRLERPYLLFVGRLDPRKNLPFLIEAFAESRARRDGVRLLLAGPPGRDFDAVRAAIRRTRCNEAVIWTDYFPDEELPLLYGAANGFLYPSIWEGFGLPILEAMACGAPVAASNVSAHPEVVGDAGFLLPPDDRSAWSEAIDALAEGGGEIERLRRKGVSLAQRFTWRATARGLLEIYRGIC